MFKTLTTPVLLSLVLLLSACANTQSQTLYQELNGEQGINAIVDNFVRHIAKDPQIFPYFAKASVSHFKKGFNDHLCDITGGPCQYKGDSMVDIHTGMNINEADFNRVVELLIMAMDDADVAYPTQNRVLALLAPLRGSVIKM